MTQREWIDLLTHLRSSYHLTQEELAGALGVTNRTVSNWERGEVRPFRRNVQRVLALERELRRVREGRRGER